MITFKALLNEFNVDQGGRNTKPPKPPHAKWGGDGNQPHNPYKFISHGRTKHNEDYYEYAFVDGQMKVEVTVQIDNHYKAISVFPVASGGELSSESVRIVGLIVVDAKKRGGGFSGYDLVIQPEDEGSTRISNMFSALADRLK